MDLRAYFAETPGHGVLSTANSEGEVDAAMFGHPHVLESSTVAFIMQDKLTHVNLQSNPHAVYLFIEDNPRSGKKYDGWRLYLRKTHEEVETDRLYALHRRGGERDGKTRFLVLFEVTKVLPLSGTTRAAT